LSLKLAARLVTLIPHKILDLQENDTTAHIADLSSILPDGVKAILIKSTRISGTGDFKQYPRSSTASITLPLFNLAICPIDNAELKWANSVANDDWDIWFYGYFVQRRTR